MQRAQEFEQSERQIDAALLHLFSNEQLYTKHVLPKLGKDVRRCEDDLQNLDKLGLREFLSLGTSGEYNLINLGGWIGRGVQRLWNRIAHSKK